VRREQTGTRFTTAVSYVAVLGLGLAFVGAFLDPRAAFRGSVAATALVGLVFAGHNAHHVRETGTPRLASAAIATVFGVWLAVAPLTYDVTVPATAAVQLSGTLVAAFAGHSTVEVVETLLDGRTGEGRGT
jgi:glucose dehydrogenase